MFDALFGRHPREIGETYSEHAGHALYISIRMLLAGLACLIHAIVPGLFVMTASNAVDDINALRARREAGAAQKPASGVAAMMENPSS